jgi:2-C-methyl-D-erythritol 4-phosphate cytidylyltransferase
MKIILVLPDKYVERGEGIAASLNAKEKINVTNGGITRFHSVQNGLKLADENSVVFVHDGVRCLISEMLIKRCYIQAIEKGSAVPAVTAIDSIRIDNGTKTLAVNRRQVYIIQTPQTFLGKIILPAYQQEYKDVFTDEATVVEAYGKNIFLIEGIYCTAVKQNCIILHYK